MRTRKTPSKNVLCRQQTTLCRYACMDMCGRMWEASTLTLGANAIIRHNLAILHPVCILFLWVHFPLGTNPNMWVTPPDQRLIPWRPPERGRKPSFSDRAAAGSRGGTGSGGCAVVALPTALLRVVGSVIAGGMTWGWFLHPMAIGVYGIPNKHQ